VRILCGNLLDIILDALDLVVDTAIHGNGCGNGSGKKGMTVFLILAITKKKRDSHYIMKVL